MEWSCGGWEGLSGGSLKSSTAVCVYMSVGEGGRGVQEDKDVRNEKERERRKT